MVIIYRARPIQNRSRNKTSIRVFHIFLSPFAWNWCASQSKKAAAKMVSIIFLYLQCNKYFDENLMNCEIIKKLYILCELIYKIVNEQVQTLSNDIDLLHPPADVEKRKHKLKRLVQTPNSFFMVPLSSLSLSWKIYYFYISPFIYFFSISLIGCQVPGLL